jgi:sigma 54 modulation/S30EA-like ribosomal protein
MIPTVQYGATRLSSRKLTQEATARVADALSASGTGTKGLRVRVATAAGGAGLMVGQANLTTCGWALRAQATCEPPQEIGGLLAERLNRQQALLTGGPWLRPWPDPLPRVPPLPVGAAVVTRRKRAVLQDLDPGAALLALDARDFQAHLYFDPQTNAEAVVYRGAPCGYRLVRKISAELPVSPPAALVVDWCVAPVLTLNGALARLTAFGETHLFFTDAVTHRGMLLYARYAGGYGLIEPAP